MEIITWFTAVGAAAQILFASRMLVQWVLSERARAVVNPALFWWLSLLASLLMSFYGYLRHDLAIMLWQLISYYIYIYNLKLKGQLARLNILITVFLVAAPIVLLVSEWQGPEEFAALFLNDEHIPYELLALGFVGQALFTLRFVYQLYASYRLKVSVLPPAFWVISLIACLMVQVYGVFRLDVVLVFGQAGGLITYTRNIMLYRKARTKQGEAVEPESKTDEKSAAK
ncbi:MAG: lipid-A-disaccharide synthase N-terminal domain-containing protein [Proteobacteria bacterium]|uniref:Lipid-A-disaccharide synthase N-terminal domain-containing protein n=1 Tax=Candidatus Avisuccinivibrio stercorigallinarum TaxID=2840704 RepID=A0A9D9DC94_9GAMM|nr:lipid-A-disaccharide synthase N-terminal domain-containing protein [Candidatus Avisuccinivibrio stercorigallinarum]